MANAENLAIFVSTYLVGNQRQRGAPCLLRSLRWHCLNTFRTISRQRGISFLTKLANRSCDIAEVLKAIGLTTIGKNGNAIDLNQRTGLGESRDHDHRDGRWVGKQKFFPHGTDA